MLNQTITHEYHTRGRHSLYLGQDIMDKMNVSVGDTLYIHIDGRYFTMSTWPTRKSKGNTPRVVQQTKRVHLGTDIQCLPGQTGDAMLSTIRNGYISGYIV